MATNFVAEYKPEISALKGEKLWEFPPYNRTDGWKRVRNQKSATGIVPDGFCLDKYQVAERQRAEARAARDAGAQAAPKVRPTPTVAQN